MDSKKDAFEALLESFDEIIISNDSKSKIYNNFLEWLDESANDSTYKSDFTKMYFFGKNLKEKEESYKIEIINNFICILYENLPAQQFNEVIGKGWIKRYFRDDLKNIFDKDPLKTIENYQKRLIENNYMYGKTKVNREENNIIIKMENGCIYGKFCSDTKNQKCIRGRVIKDLLELSDPKNSYRPVLIKENEHDRECEIKLNQNEIKNLDELFVDMEKEKYFL